ncbi:hypothetical protein [Kutzneria sp. 744]|uniref:hypothetical protein n=1 Tax=Kutzneria sp. (strain 744) TaxID=345341 RepID=UPI0003EEBDCD|nr:hypothetical protein [Kutzneria sp. 744]EWM17412.1 hypothetical protein KUTG_07716 [Kutzneria sp. 744]
MKLAGKTAYLAHHTATNTVATVLRREGARVETEATPAEAAARFGGLDIVFAVTDATAALPHLRDNGTVILCGRADAHPPAAQLEPKRIRVNYVVADATTALHEIAEAVLHLASDEAFKAQGEEIVLATALALAS